MARRRTVDGDLTVSRRRQVAVVAPNDLNWAAVRQLLAGMADIEIVRDIRNLAEGFSYAGGRPPEAIVSAPALAGEPTLRLLEMLRSHWPDARVIVLVDRFESDQAAEFTLAPKTSCLCWNDLSPEALRHCILAALAAPLRMVSASIAEQEPRLLDTPSRLDPVSDKGTAVLRGLGAGLTQQQVALQEGISLRTVQRVIADLQTQFNARSLFALGRAVEQLGLLSEPSIAPARHTRDQKTPSFGR
jgi:DNA-binding NarL/FixJ family response regulator